MNHLRELEVSACLGAIQFWLERNQPSDSNRCSDLEVLECLQTWVEVSELFVVVSSWFDDLCELLILRLLLLEGLFIWQSLQSSNCSQSSIDFIDVLIHLLIESRNWGLHRFSQLLESFIDLFSIYRHCLLELCSHLPHFFVYLIIATLTTLCRKLSVFILCILELDQCGE